MKLKKIGIVIVAAAVFIFIISYLFLPASPVPTEGNLLSNRTEPEPSKEGNPKAQGNVSQQGKLAFSSLSPEIQKEVLRLSNPTMQGLVETENESGVRTIELKGHFRHVPVARIGADGQIVIEEIYPSKPGNE